ncbi:formyl transferase [Limtongia smithiae]|uniref:formyl transferase n=1 Tax=Limtongia smithiae TaxID=1125753 RepID=UPI0034CF060A
MPSPSPVAFIRDSILRSALRSHHRQFTRSFKCTAHTPRPLRIILFGSDEFSIASLTHLYQLQRKKPDVIASIDVGARLPKAAGRGRKDIVEVPLLDVARDLELPCHEAETDDDFHDLAAQNYDIAIAVSYGKLIPAYFLRSLPLGGINLHPSFLPRHSGAAPIQWAIYSNDLETGVTVQTLHPTKFDKGRILIQSEPVSIDQKSDNFAMLRPRLAKVGARLLDEAVCVLAHVADSVPASAGSGVKEFADRTEAIVTAFTKYTHTVHLPTATAPSSHAPKLTKDRLRVDWLATPAALIARTYRAFGTPLWTNIVMHQKRNPRSITSRRVLLEDVRVLDPAEELGLAQQDLPVVPGQYVRMTGGSNINSNGAVLVVRTSDGGLLSVRAVSESYAKKPPKVDSPVFDRQLYSEVDFVRMESEAEVEKAAMEQRRRLAKENAQAAAAAKTE